MNLTQLSLHTGSTQIRVGCHRLAYGEANYDQTGYVLGLHGPESSLRAVRAVLCDPSIKGTLEWHYDPDEESCSSQLKRVGEGYRCYKHRLAEHTWQFTFVANDPGLLLSADDESLWRALMSEQYTTPLLRDWLPAVRAKLEERKLLRFLHGDTRSALLTAETQDLDRIVSEGLREGTFVIPARKSA